ncbi:MAG: hypothetical protein SGI96_04645 [Bacteroidota bacterium]|nr:hypothetical protein [Bacteroidota bacterium]
MKKFLAIIAIASFAVACNNNGEKKEGTDTTTKVINSADTVTTVTNSDTTVRQPGDTTIKKTTETDTTKPNM